MTDHEPGLALLQNPTVGAIALFRAVREMRRHVGHTARGALVLGYISPFHARKSREGERPPEGFAEVTYTGRLLPEMNGTWWVPLVRGAARADSDVISFRYSHDES